MNAKFNFIGDIKFNWINDYDIYKSFINAIKRSRISNFISENAIENFEHISELCPVTISTLFHFIGIDTKYFKSSLPK